MKFLIAYGVAYPKFVDGYLLKRFATHFVCFFAELAWIVASPLLVLFYVCWKPGAWDRWFFEKRR